MRSQNYPPISSGYSSQTSLLEAYAQWAQDVFAAFRLQMRAWERRARARNELITLCDRDLRDVGLTRAEAAAEVRKSFWRA
jgi:uncharacterized protein YjiS (DUF1127 family)